MAGISATTILFAALGGIVPTFVWLWFWLSEASRPEPRMLIILGYVGGMLGVLLLLPLHSFVEGLNLANSQITILYAILEEVMKVSIIALLAFGPNICQEATDYTIYLVTGALGFSALENTLYLIDPIAHATDIGTIVVTGNIRFLGATVLHTVTVAIVGVLIGLAFPFGKFGKFVAAIVGIGFGVGIHIGFNTLIMQDTPRTTIIAIASIWMVAVTVIILYTRLKAFQEKASPV